MIAKTKNSILIKEVISNNIFFFENPNQQSIFFYNNYF